MATTSQKWASMERQRFGSCILDNEMAMQWCYPIIKVLASFIGKNATDDIATTS